MRTVRFKLAALLAAGVMTCATHSVLSQTTQWVERGDTGRLIYTPDAEGDRILDFSNVGYKGQGAAAIPDNIASVITLSPIAGDDTTQIQSAINSLASQPLGADGYRGAILLQAGTYDINSQLLINASGIVLRGEGQGTSGTILQGRNVGAQGTNQRPLIRIEGSGSQTLFGSTVNMIDKTVPAGTNSFRVDNPGAFSVGNTVRIDRPSNQAWIDDVGMGQPLNGDPAWVPGTMNLRYDRVITRIEGDRVFIDSPLANSFEQQYGGGTIKRYAWAGAIENVGVENLRGDTDFDHSTDEDHAWEFISIGGSSTSNRAQDVWVRDITARHFGDSAVVANPSSKWVTVANAISIDPVSVITGSRRYTYDLSGSHGFVTGSSADEGRHDFVTNSTRPAGPSVFHNSTATNANSDSGPHQRWSSGTLYDQITVNGNAINARNRETFGTRHGWSGANIVVWNSDADSFRIQNPPTSQNWLIGSTGTIVEDTTFGPQPPGNYDSHGTNIADIPSLYDAQAADDADVDTYQWDGADGNWNDAQGWDQRATPLLRSVEQRDYLIGDIDGFVNDGPGSVDEAVVDPDFEAEILTSSAHPITGFDDLTDNRNVAFTQQYVLDPGDVIVHGSLALGLRQSGGLVDTDTIKIDGAGQMSFTALGWDTQINPTDTFVGVIDLGTTELLPILNNDSQLSVRINDDTGADWALLSVTVLVDQGGGAADVFLNDSQAVLTVDSAVDPVDNLMFGSGTLRIDPGADLDVLDNLDVVFGGIPVLSFGIDASGASLLEVDGDADLNVANVDMDLLGGFVPTLGQAFDLLTATTIVGGSLNPLDIDDWGLSIIAGGNGQILRATYLGSLVGDLDGDGFVGINDLNIVLANWNQDVPPGNPLADPSGDGFVGIDDLNTVLGNWNAGTPPGANASANIPEPGTLGILMATALLRNRRR